MSETSNPYESPQLESIEGGQSIFGGLTPKNIADCMEPIETISHFRAPDGVPEAVYEIPE